MPDPLDRFQSRLRAELPFLAEQYHVSSLGIFGSYLHGTQRPDSDLDVLVSFSTVPTLFELIELENHLTDTLGVKVDLVMGDSLKPRIAANVLREVVPV